MKTLYEKMAGGLGKQERMAWNRQRQRLKALVAQLSSDVEEALPGCTRPMKTLIEIREAVEALPLFCCHPSTCEPSIDVVHGGRGGWVGPVEIDLGNGK
ncbi:MAG: hypothetical protein EG824_06890 [Deltaproteobacteria bacterium]|nr:hypothetical protein [Deltaproteobacteria bacterium]